MPQELRPHPLPEVFLRITHISETILSILTKLCPNVPCMILFQSYVRYVWGPKKGPRGGLKWLIILIFKNLFLVNQQCQKIDTWHITLINLENRNPVWPNEFNLQLGCCISDAFSIFLLFMDRTSSFIAEHERSRLASIFFLRSPSHKSVS